MQMRIFKKEEDDTEISPSVLEKLTLLQKLEDGNTPAKSPEPRPIPVVYSGLLIILFVKNSELLVCVITSSKEFNIVFNFFCNVWKCGATLNISNSLCVWLISSHNSCKQCCL